MTSEEVYKTWRSTIEAPDDSLFYCHPSLESILLGLSIFVLTPQPSLGKLGKAEPLKILHLQVPRLITAWIDEDDETFEALFPTVITVCESYMMTGIAFAKKYPLKHKIIQELMAFFALAIPSGGDMNPTLAEELLDDLTTDGRSIYSDKVKAFGLKLLLLARKYDLDVPAGELNRLNGW